MANRARVVTEDREVRDYQMRYLRYRWHETDRSLMISGRIPGADGATVWKALHRIATDSEADPETGEFERYQARCADALVRIASHSIAADSDVDRATIVVHADAATLLTGSGPAEIESGPTIAHSVLRRLACDSRLELVMDGPDGQPVGIGRRSRVVPGWLKRQLNHRDRGCRFPGCGRIRWTQAHHIIHWADGGRTDLDNLIMLCGFHHRFLHDRGWS
ncbi:MAG: HNH endonuclease, partial [Acidimicrobiia bacterium]|nr:HNH endonuclease [Acidimicrobiia bacterium]